ncbi:hypothetical protein NDU88_004669 [Pleurodeles waltl]|uniref:Uncharacterized protein n=1 Tax=Pleurodeles waltl TaxID=8319 RepID=A0AAV7W989_PLEWA|nr:hypothetical protein NDU88_004669 [Pleurodeles waltl]
MLLEGCKPALFNYLGELKRRSCRVYTTRRLRSTLARGRSLPAVQALRTIGSRGPARVYGFIFACLFSASFIIRHTAVLGVRSWAAFNKLHYGVILLHAGFCRAPSITAKIQRVPRADLGHDSADEPWPGPSDCELLVPQWAPVMYRRFMTNGTSCGEKRTGFAIVIFE